MDKTTSLLKTHNKLINIIRCQPEVSKSALAESLKVSWPTVANNIEILKKMSILDISDGLCINPSYAHMIGVSIGAAQIKLSIINMNFVPIDNSIFKQLIETLELFSSARKHMENNGKEISNYIFFNTPDTLFELQTQLDAIIADIIKMISYQEQFRLNIISIGLAFTGAIDNKNKKIIKSHNLEYLTDKTLNNIIYPNRLEFFEQKNINIYVDNNSTMSVVAEKYNMYIPGNTNYKYRNKENILSIYLGTGIGAGMVFNNKLYHGAANFVGELGHIEVPIYPGLSFKTIEKCCSCGSCNCLDYRIRNDVFEMSKTEFSMLDSKAIKDFFTTHSEKFEIFLFYLGEIINLLINLLNLDLIIFTGKFKDVADQMWPLLYKHINSNKLSYIANTCELKSSNLGATSPSIGVAICAYFDKINEEIEW